MDKSAVKTLGGLVKASASEYGDKVFIREKCGRDIADVTFNEFCANSERINAYIKEISDGEKIHAAVIGATGSGYLESYFGTVMGGNVIVPLDAQLSCEDIAELINRSDSQLLFCDPKFAAVIPQLRESCKALRAVIFVKDGEGADITVPQIIEKYQPLRTEEPAPEALAAIVYTSGTTGKAKGVMLTHGNLIDNTMCMDNESSPEDVLLTVLPVHHVYCFTCDILCSLRYGATLCVNDAMMRIAQNLKLFKPTLILLVPMIAETIYKQIKVASAAKPDIAIKDIANAVFGGRLKGIFSGGAYLSPELIDSYKELGIPIAQGYGMTECSPRISTADLVSENLGDVGTIVGGCSVRIDDGEIVVKSPSVMQGYYKDEAATAEAFTADGWLRTGDLGYVKDNRVYITGRKKNLIILSNGENVSPEEIENKFAAVDMVQEMLVYAEDGVITAEFYLSDDVCADMTADEKVSALRAVVDKINPTLTSAKAIRRIRVRDKEFDKTTSKKIRRNQTEQGAVV